MADLRVLKLALLAETKDFIAGLDNAEKSTKTFSQKLGKAVKGAALAFGALALAAGAAAIKIGKDAVEGAAADQKAQDLLAKSLKNVTKATDIQIRSVEDYIAKTERSSAVNADLLRPSLDRLVRSTKDVTEAQKLQKLALDISAGTGKDLSTVTEALGKAYDGNLGALKRIGVPLDENIVKSKDFDAAVKVLSETFDGQAEVAANTFAGRLEKIKLRIDEAKDEIGFALLPVLERLSIFITENILPAFDGLVRGLTGGPRSVRGATKETNSAFADLGIVIDENDSAAFDLGEALRDLAGSIKDLFATAEDGTTEESGLVRFINLLERIVDASDRMIARIDAVKNKIKEFNDAFNNSAIGQFANATGQFAPGVAQEKFASLGGVGSTMTPINVTIRGNPDPQRAGRDIIKVINKNSATTGARFNFGFR